MWKKMPIPQDLKNQQQTNIEEQSTFNLYIYGRFV